MGTYRLKEINTTQPIVLYGPYFSTDLKTPVVVFLKEINTQFKYCLDIW